MLIYYISSSHYRVYFRQLMSHTCSGRCQTVVTGIYRCGTGTVLVQYWYNTASRYMRRVVLVLCAILITCLISFNVLMVWSYLVMTIASINFIWE